MNFIYIQKFIYTSILDQECLFKFYEAVYILIFDSLPI